MTVFIIVLGNVVAVVFGFIAGRAWERNVEDDQAAAGADVLPQRVGRPDVRPYEPPSRFSDGGRP